MKNQLVSFLSTQEKGPQLTNSQTPVTSERKVLTQIVLKSIQDLRLLGRVHVSTTNVKSIEHDGFPKFGFCDPCPVKYYGNLRFT